MVENILDNLMKSAEVIDNGQDSTVLLRRVEVAINRSIDAEGRQTQEEQQRYLELLQGIDNRLEALQDNPRLKVAYTKLADADPESFWERGLPKFRELRKTIWNEIVSE